jgi:uncharacterized spore protein YtfJ
MLNLETIVERVDDTISARRVFGEPVVKDGVTVIPVARVMGGAGGGEGPAPTTTGEPGSETRPASVASGGIGFGLAARPAGVYVMKGDSVRWIPAVDVNRIVFGMQMVAIVLLLVVRSMAKSRASTHA